MCVDALVERVHRGARAWEEVFVDYGAAVPGPAPGERDALNGIGAGRPVVFVEDWVLRVQRSRRESRYWAAVPLSSPANAAWWGAAEREL